MTTTSINEANQAETIIGAQAVLKGKIGGQDAGNSQLDRQAQAQNEAANQGKPESALRASARRHGLTMKELAALLEITPGHLSAIANGHRPLTPNLRGKVQVVLGEVPAQGVVYRRGGAVTSESSVIRERAREQGMTLKDLAVVVGVSHRYMTRAPRSA